MTAHYAPSLTVNDCIEALGVFLTPFLAAGGVAQIAVRGQVNRVPMPIQGGVVLTELMTTGIGRPRTDWPMDSVQPEDQIITLSGPTRIDVQCDFYSEGAGDVCEAVRIAFDSSWAYEQFPPDVKPLYISEGRQGPLVSGEQQYVNRFTADVAIQYNPVVIVDQQSALDAEVTTIEAFP